MLPAEQVGVGWSDDALERALALAQGYPYFLQLCGDAVWRRARPETGDTLTRTHLLAAEADVADQRETMFRSRWAKASPAERRGLAAMARLSADAPVRRADLAAELGVHSTDLSVLRRSLLDKGLVEVVARGTLAFTTPGFADFVRGETEG